MLRLLTRNATGTHPLTNFKFYSSDQMPFRPKDGFLFTVHENNVIIPDHVMGRAFITHEDAVRYMKDGDVPLLSIGTNIGTIKVKLVGTKMFQTFKIHL